MTTLITTSIVRCFVAATCFIAVTATQVHADDRDTTTKVNGVIAQMRSGLITVTTSWGHMTIQSDALTEAKVGDEITVWVNENNAVIDAYPKGAARPHHRWVRGHLTYTSGNQDAITLWTPEGQKDFIVKQNQSKFGSFVEGSPITVQLNDKGEVIDVHRRLELELAYAPPYGSAKDLVNLAGMAAQNVLAGNEPLRTFVGAAHIPLDELRQRVSELPRDRELIVYCQSGQRSYIAARILSQQGFRVCNLTGGHRTWRVTQPQ